MAHTYEELKHKTVAELREIAKSTQHDAVQGYTQMNKERLLPALCSALGIDPHEHHAAVTAEKASLKAQMRQLKADCDKAIAEGDHDTLHRLRRRHHKLNHGLRVSARRATQH